MRISGINLVENQHIAIGAHHTINIEANKKIKIFK
jgi:stalled ribosome rescue protein Dom34